MNKIDYLSGDLRGRIDDEITVKALLKKIGPREKKGIKKGIEMALEEIKKNKEKLEAKYNKLMPDPLKEIDDDAD